jgi:hypothetical protein
VKSYARFVGLDAELVADQFKAELADMPRIHGLSQQANELDFTDVYRRKTVGQRRWTGWLERIGGLTTGLVFFAVVAAYFAWRFFAQR